MGNEAILLSCLSGLNLQLPPPPLQTQTGVPEFKEGLFQSSEAQPQNDDITATSQAISASLGFGLGLCPV